MGEIADMTGTYYTIQEVKTGELWLVLRNGLPFAFASSLEQAKMYTRGEL